MSLIRHDSIDAERLAMLWHQIGGVLSAASVCLGMGGMFWHLWAARQHAEALLTLRNRPRPVK